MVNKYISFTQDELYTLERVLNEVDVRDIFPRMKSDKITRHNINLMEVLEKIEKAIYE